MIRVVIVDDYPMIQQSLSLLLASIDDITVVGIGENGLDAITLCEQHIPDAILLDYQMPVMDGLTASLHIHEQFPQIHIILLKSISSYDVQPNMASHVDTFLSKDVAGEVIIKALRQFVADK